MNYIKISWRNIWRNRRRTIITAASVMFAVAYSILMRSFQEGTYSRAIENMVRMFSGHLQVQSAGFWDDQVIDNALYIDNGLIDTIKTIENVEQVFPRLQYFGFVSTGKVTREGFIIGADHQTEDYISKVSDKLIAGNMITNEDESVLLGEGLARYLNVTTVDTIFSERKEDNVTVIDTTYKTRIINDTIIILGQGYHGSTAVGKLHVKGIVKLPIYDINKRAIYMSMPATQTLFNTPGMCTSLNIILKDGDHISDTYSHIRKHLDIKKQELMTWAEMQPELVQQIESDKGSGILMILLLYLIIGFGIFGTVIMMTSERKREFGIMVAIGMRKERLAKTVANELLYMGIIGSIAGTILIFPVLLYFWYNPIEFTGDLAKSYEQYGWEAIMPLTIDIRIFITQALVVFCLFAITGLYPILKILHLDVTKSIHS